MAKDLVIEFHKTIKIKPSNTKKLFAIGFIGTTGVGKSTTAMEIGNKFGLYVACNDEIRRFMNKHGYPGKFPKQELLQQIAEETTRYLYKNKISHVIDADLIKFHTNATKNASDYDAQLILIHLVCPESIILQRLGVRKSDIEKIKKSRSINYENIAHSLSTFKEYEERTKLHKTLPLPINIFHTIDTSKDLSPQITQLEIKLKKQGMI